MGKRYGRNQKRRHRERIAALEAENASIVTRLYSVYSQLASLQLEIDEWDEEIRRLLGNYSAMRRKTPEVDSRHPIREMPIIQSVSMSAASSDTDMMMAIPARERMMRFVCTIDRDDIRMQRLIRFMEKDGHGGVAYSISETALRQGFGRREVAYMAHEIADNLAKHWNSREW